LRFRDHAADEVYVTGTFDNWSKSQKLEKVGDSFEKTVTLPDASKKIYYKVRLYFPPPLRYLSPFPHRFRLARDFKPPSVVQERARDEPIVPGALLLWSIEAAQSVHPFSVRKEDANIWSFETRQKR
jgi:Glycogen recognition site of AMP-activated protein kinase